METNTIYIFFLILGGIAPTMCLKILQKPMCLIISSPEGALMLDEAVAAELSLLDKPCVVVGIVGMWRTGKSYLMNRLAGHTSGQSDTCNTSHFVFWYF